MEVVQYKPNMAITNLQRPFLGLAFHLSDLSCLFTKVTSIFPSEWQGTVLFFSLNDLEHTDDQKIFLSQLSLLVLPVTTNLLAETVPDLSALQSQHIPLLPILMEPDLESLYDRTLGLRPYLDWNCLDWRTPCLEASAQTFFQIFQGCSGFFAGTPVAAPEGDSLSQAHTVFLSGLSSLYGVHAPLDRQLGAERISQAAQAGLPEALEKLAFMYRLGEAVPVQEDTCLKQLALLSTLYEERWNAGSLALDVYAPFLFRWAEVLVRANRTEQACSIIGKLLPAAQSTPWACKACRWLAMHTDREDNSYWDTWKKLLLAGAEATHSLDIQRRLIDFYEQFAYRCLKGGYIQRAVDALEQAIIISKELAAETKISHDQRTVIILEARMAHFCSSSSAEKSIPYILDAVGRQRELTARVQTEKSDLDYAAVLLDASWYLKDTVAYTARSGSCLQEACALLPQLAERAQTISDLEQTARLCRSAFMLLHGSIDIGILALKLLKQLYTMTKLECYQIQLSHMEQFIAAH